MKKTKISKTLKQETTKIADGSAWRIVYHFASWPRNKPFYRYFMSFLSFIQKISIWFVSQTIRLFEPTQRKIERERDRHRETEYVSHKVYRFSAINLHTGAVTAVKPRQLTVKQLNFFFPVQHSRSKRESNRKTLTGNLNVFKVVNECVVQYPKVKLTLFKWEFCQLLKMRTMRVCERERKINKEKESCLLSSFNAYRFCFSFLSFSRSNYI